MHGSSGLPGSWAGLHVRLCYHGSELPVRAAPRSGRTSARCSPPSRPPTTAQPPHQLRLDRVAARRVRRWDGNGRRGMYLDSAPYARLGPRSRGSGFPGRVVGADFVQRMLRLVAKVVRSRRSTPMLCRCRSHHTSRAMVMGRAETMISTRALEAAGGSARRALVIRGWPCPRTSAPGVYQFYVRGCSPGSADISNIRCVTWLQVHAGFPGPGVARRMECGGSRT